MKTEGTATASAQPALAAPAAPTDDQRQAHLRALLRDSTRWDAEYQDYLSTHLPMALTALHRLGAPPARLEAFAAAYSARLHAAPPPQAWPPGEPWRGRFGDALAWPAYRDFFRQWLAHEGAGDVLQQALPWLMAGCGAGAFHGLIRTAYAFEALVPEELADGLAYWACRWLDLGPAAPRAVAPALRVRDPARLAAGLAALPTSSAPVIVLRMLDASRKRGFAPLVARLQIDGRTLPLLARHAAQRYARSGNFTVLHLLTGAHALRVLMPFIEEEGEALAHYWRAYAAGGVAAKDVPGRAAPLLDWPDLTAAAIASDDDHLVKLVDACRQEQQAYGGAPDWQRAASRAVADAARRGGGTRSAVVIASSANGQAGALR